MLKETKQMRSSFSRPYKETVIGSPLTNKLKIELSSEYFGEL